MADISQLRKQQNPAVAGLPMLQSAGLTVMTLADAPPAPAAGGAMRGSPMAHAEAVSSLFGLANVVPGGISAAGRLSDAGSTISPTVADAPTSAMGRPDPQPPQQIATSQRQMPYANSLRASSPQFAESRAAGAVGRELRGVRNDGLQSVRAFLLQQGYDPDTILNALNGSL